MKREFNCERCGFCCMGESTVSLDESKITEISRYLGVEKEDLINDYLVVKKNRIEMKTRDGYCIFFDTKEKICTIHPVKPVHCKNWPLHKSILNDEESFNIIKETCPSLKKLKYSEVCEIIGEIDDSR